MWPTTEEKITKTTLESIPLSGPNRPSTYEVVFNPLRPTAAIGVFCDSGQRPAHSYLAVRFAHAIWLLTYVSAAFPAQV